MEFFGSFCLNLALTMHSNSRLQQEDQPYAVMLTIILIVVIGAPISGAHYNPNITLAFWMTGDKKARGPARTQRISRPPRHAPTRHSAPRGIAVTQQRPVYPHHLDWSARCATVRVRPRRLRRRAAGL